MGGSGAAAMAVEVSSFSNSPFSQNCMYLSVDVRAVQTSAMSTEVCMLADQDTVIEDDVVQPPTYDLNAGEPLAYPHSKPTSPACLSTAAPPCLLQLCMRMPPQSALHPHV